VDVSVLTNFELTTAWISMRKNPPPPPSPR
jgi:hypothetical protein